MPIPLKRTSKTGWCLFVAETGLGIVLAVTTVTLWVAWTPSVFIVVVAVAIVSAALLALLNQYSHSESEIEHAGRHSGWSRQYRTARSVLATRSGPSIG